MALCWAFALRAVASRAYAVPSLVDTETMGDVAMAIEAAAEGITMRGRVPIPV
jgi:hypothetical protein